MSRFLSTFFVCFILLSFTAIIGCARKPSVEVINKLIIKYSNIYKYFPRKVEKTIIHHTEIIQYGNYNKKRKYWPIKIKINGTSTLVKPTKKEISWDEEFDCSFYYEKDDYGNGHWRLFVRGFWISETS